MAKTLTRTAIISSASNAAGSTTRGRLDCTGVDGGIVTMRLTTGATGPTAQCECRVLVAHKDSAMPAAGAEGTGDGGWKQVRVFGSGTVANISARDQYVFGPEVAYIEIEATGNTGQAVTVEAIATTYSY